MCSFNQTVVEHLRMELGTKKERLLLSSLQAQQKLICEVGRYAGSILLASPDLLSPFFPCSPSQWPDNYGPHIQLPLASSKFDQWRAPQEMGVGGGRRVRQEYVLLTFSLGSQLPGCVFWSLAFFWVLVTDHPSLG